MANKENLSVYFLNALKKRDSSAKEALLTANDVKLYRFDVDASRWKSTDFEGTLYFYQRTGKLSHGLLLVAKDSVHTWTRHFDENVELQLRAPFLLYRSFDSAKGMGLSSQSVIEGLWFPSNEKCEEFYACIMDAVNSLSNQLSYADVASRRAERDQERDSRHASSVVFNYPQPVRDDEDKVLVMQNPNKSLDDSVVCHRCGEIGHSVKGCDKLAGHGEKEMRRNSPLKGHGQFQRQVSQPNPMHLLADSANSLQVRREKSPVAYLNLSPQKPQVSLMLPPINSSNVVQHSSSFPAGLDNLPPPTADLTPLSPHKAVIDVREASHQLREFLKIPSRNAVQPATVTTRTSARLESVSSLSDSENKLAYKFVRDVTEKLEAVVRKSTIDEDPIASSSNPQAQLLPPDFSSLSDSNNFPGDDAVTRTTKREPSHTEILKPPHEFENLAMLPQQSLLVPDDFEKERSIHQKALDKDQMVQAFQWLLKNDSDFGRKLHDAYIKSMSGSG